MPLEVEVVSQVRQLYHTDAADMVIVPGSEGELGVLPNHTPLLSTLTYGELRIVEKDKVESFVIYGGVVEILPDKVTVLADDAESVTEIDPKKVEEARQHARELMAAEPTGEQRTQIAQELRRAEIAVKITRRVASSQGQQIHSTADDNEHA